MFPGGEADGETATKKSQDNNTAGSSKPHGGQKTLMLRRVLLCLFKSIFVPLTKNMVRSRKQNFVDPRRDNKDRKKPPKTSSTKSKYRRKIPSGSTILILLAVLCFFGGLGYIWWRHYKQNRLYTPIVARRMIARSEFGDMGDIRRFWGSYRSNLYFGLRTRSPNSLMLGLMWFSGQSSDDKIQIRHSCEQSDKLRRYGWIRHDGINFGTQEIVDNENGCMLTTDFVKRTGGDHGGDWTARISGRALEGVDAEASVCKLDKMLLHNIMIYSFKF